MGDNTTRIWAGLDLGGTGTRAVIVDDEGRTLNGATMRTSSFGPDAVDQLANHLSDLIAHPQHLAGIGIGASGPVDLSTGQIHNPDTLPQFTGLDVAAGLQQALAAPAWIDNDAVVAGLAETQWGRAGASESLLCVTLGTGIGAVLIEAGRPRRAADGQHPEAGHIPVAGTGNPCYCGLAQCWEQVASRTALDELRRTGERDAAGLWVEYAERVAGGLVTLVTLYHPARIVIGGGVAQHWVELEGPLLDALSRFREYDPATTLVASTLGERAGALGAALLPQRGIGWHHCDSDESPEKKR